MTVLTLVMSFMLLGQVVVWQYDHRNGVGVSDDRDATAFRFDASEFFVTFTAKPKIEECEGRGPDMTPIPMMRAEYRARDYFLRAEVVAISKTFSSTVTKSDVISRLRELASHSGLATSVLSFEVTALGKTGTMRGTKILEVDGTQTAVTFESVVYYGRSTMLCLSVGGPSVSYPPSEVVRFLKSVAAKPNQ